VRAPGLSDPGLWPPLGSTSTEFTYGVTYTQGENVAPEEAWVVILQPDGTPLREPMSTSDTTYADGSLYTYTTKLTNGNYSYYFQFKSVGIVVKTATYTGPGVDKDSSGGERIADSLPPGFAWGVAPVSRSSASR